MHRLALAAAVVCALACAQTPITPPEQFFGHQLGADRKIARWDGIVDYFSAIEKQSAGRLKVVNLGPTTEGNPFLLVILSSAANLSNLEALRQTNLAIGDPRGRAEAEIKRLAAQGKAVVCQTMSLHASEIGGTQMAPELAYDLLARTDEEARRILENVIFLLVPSFNPDGQIMVTDWYRKWAGTEYEGANLPWLYHKYAGHDNNRDAFMTNLVESQYLARILFREWKPQAYVDHHHMGPYGARIYVPPYAEPIRPLADPLVWREMSWYGAHIACKEEEADLSGVLNMAQYSGWGHFGFHWITPFHNIAGMLTESASARLATPLFIHPTQLRGGVRGMPDYEPQTTFPNPWPGGWWRLRDVVERQKVSAWATLDLVARNRETVLWNAYLKARRQSERGAQGKPAVYMIPAAQHDPLTAAKLVNKLLGQGIDVHRLDQPFTAASGMTYSAGSYAVSLAQPKMGLIRYLLGRTFYPDNEWTRNRDGAPSRPYDMAADTLFEYMGVRVDALDQPVSAAMTMLSAGVRPAGTIAGSAAMFSFDGRLNDSFRALNLLYDKDAAVRRIDKPAAGLRPGDFVVTAPLATLDDIARATGVTFSAAGADVSAASHALKRLRIGLYQRYRGGNADEGWTRLTLEQFGFPYKTLMDAEIKKAGLNANFDVIILPGDSTGTLTGEGGGRAERPPESVPPDYRSGFGAEGVKAIKEFVEKGGTLVTFGEAGGFAIEKLGLDLRNVLSGRTTKEFWCPGSTLRVQFENTNRYAYGMPAAGLSLFLGGNPVFDIAPTEHSERYEIIVRYADRDLLESGWLVGEQMIAKKAAMVAARLGQGRVVLCGMQPQHRSQMHGTFKLLFNALLP